MFIDFSKSIHTQIIEQNYVHNERILFTRKKLGMDH